MNIYNNLTTALNESNRESRFVLILLSTKTCKWCDKLKSSIHDDPSFLVQLDKLNTNFAIIELPSKNMDTLTCEGNSCTIPPANTGIRAKYNITELPTLLLFNSSSELIDRTHYLEKDALISFVSNATLSDDEL